MPEAKGGNSSTKKKGGTRPVARPKGLVSKVKNAPETRPATGTKSASRSRKASPGTGATRSKSTAAKPAAPKPAAPKGRPAPARRQGVTKKRARSGSPAAELSGTSLAPLTDEEQIESSKYLPRQAAKRLFEEERFVFPQSYGRDRVRLLVKDPEWLFAHWDLDRGSVSGLSREVGERAVALSKLTLRICDPDNGGMSVVLLPPGVRSWYVRADSTSRAYRAELGLTLPSGEFRSMAESNTVVTPRVGPSSERASRVRGYRHGRQLSSDAGLAVGLEELRATPTPPEAGPWNPVPSHSAVDSEAADRGAGASEPSQSSRTPEVGGASESFGPSAPSGSRHLGASDVHRR